MLYSFLLQELAGWRGQRRDTQAQDKGALDESRDDRMMQKQFEEDAPVSMCTCVRPMSVHSLQ